MTLAEHILFAAAIQGSALSIAYALGRCQPRLVAWFCILSILSFAFPWSYLGSWLSEFANASGVTISGAPMIREFHPAIASPQSIPSDWGSTAVGVWLLVAAFWLACTFFRARNTLKRWNEASKEGDALQEFAHSDYQDLLSRVDILLLPGSCFAVTSGLWRPKIWIGDGVATRSQLRTALNHELTHVRTGDPYLAVLLTILERTLWWNPLVWLLGAEARRQLEYACDQRCKQLLGEREYKRSLAELSLMKAGVPAVPSALALQSRNGVIIRMKRISQNYATRPAHIAIIAAFISTAVFSSIVLAEADQASKPTVVECEREIPDGARWRMSVDRDPNEGTLSVMLVDADEPDSHEVPEGAGPYIQCLFGVLGIPAEHLPVAS
jgi:beta-lactamase regulating signal transducer with metallopeptidase domain